MKLTLENLKNAGAFTGRPVQKEIEWMQGDEKLTATIFVRPMGFQTATNDVMAYSGKIDGIAGRIAASICDEEGKPVFTVDDITGEAEPERGSLDGNLSIALLVAIQEVNDLGKTTNLPEKMNSGVKSSSTASVVAPSPKQKSA
jgi:hypothetical protein